MPHKVQFSAAEVVKIWHLKAKNVKVSDIAKQMKSSRSGVYEFLSKVGNSVVKKAFRKTKKNILAVTQRDFVHSFKPVRSRFVKFRGFQLF